MHERALAEAVVAAASEAAEKEGLRQVSEVKIRVGELQQIEQDVFKFALSQLRTGKFEKAKFVIETEKAKLKCRACGCGWVFDKTKVSGETAEAVHFVPEVAHVYIKCPKCGSPDFEVLEGRGVLLQSVRGVR
jgi:hydrogenase nickel incorporation protein HypA/HybF